MQNNQILVFKALGKTFSSLTHPSLLWRILILPFLGILVGLFSVVYFWTRGLEEIERLLVNTLPLAGFIKVNEAGFFLSVVAGFLFILVMLSGVYILTLCLTSVLLTPSLSSAVRRIYYPHLNKKEGLSMLGSFKNNLLAFSFYILIFVVTLPLFLIPGLQIAIPWLLNSYVSKKIFPYDVMADFATPQEFNEFLKKNRSGLWLLALITSGFFYIPILNFLAPSLVALSFCFYCLEQATEKSEAESKVSGSS